MPFEQPLPVIVPQYLMDSVGKYSDYDLQKQYQNLFVKTGKSSQDQNVLQALQNEIDKRKIQIPQKQNEKLTQDLINKIQGTGTGIDNNNSQNVQSPAFDLSKIVSQEQGALTQQKQQLSDIFKNQVQQGTNAIESQFAPIRSKQVSEEAALGRLMSPASIPNLSRIDQQKGQALSDLISGLSSQESQANVGLESQSSQRLSQDRQFAASLGLDTEKLNLQKQQDIANIIQSQYQFGQNQSFSQQQFQEQQRQYEISQQQIQEENAAARELGLQQAQSQQPGWAQQATGIITGIGALAGGIGSLSGGLGGTAGTLGKIGAIGNIAGNTSQFGYGGNKPTYLQQYQQQPLSQRIRGTPLKNQYSTTVNPYV